MRGQPSPALAAFLGELPSKEALRTAARPPRPSKVQSRRADDSSPDSDGLPCYDGGFDPGYDDTSAPFSNPAPAFIREFDVPKGFDCQKPTPAIADLAPKRPKARVSSAMSAVSGSVTKRSQSSNSSTPSQKQQNVPVCGKQRSNSFGPTRRVSANESSGSQQSVARIALNPAVAEASVPRSSQGYLVSSSQQGSRAKFGGRG